MYMKIPDKAPQSKLKSNMKGILYAILIALVIRIVLIEPYKIPSESMYPSIMKKDMIMANKFVYGIFVPVINLKLNLFSQPKENSIALFQTPTYNSPGKIREFINFITFGIFMLDNNDNSPKFFIKRVVASPGSLLSIVNPKDTNYAYQLIVNGEKLLLNPLKEAPVFEDSSDYLFFTEQVGSKDRIVQFYKQESVFGFMDNGYKGSLYVPKKGDHLEFRMVSQKESQTEIQKSLDIGLIPQLQPEDKIRLTVFRNAETKGLFNKIQELTISVQALHNFYYTQQDANAILKEQDFIDLVSKGLVKVDAKYDYYFMMGDNRDNSSDSRYWGLVSQKYIIGSPMFRYFPFSRFGSVNLKAS